MKIWILRHGELNSKPSVTAVNYDILVNGTSYTIEVTKNNLPKNRYEQRKRLLAYCAYFKAMGYKSEEVRQLAISAYRLLNEDYHHLLKSFSDDMLELDTCYFHKAYKATLILAGSILEAFLLDWLSEIDGKDYFNEPYEVEEMDEEGNIRRVKKEQLSFYIEQIKEIKRPDWMEPSQKAHFIRKRRNSVHAKVCIKEEVDINDDTCKKVISYLKDIIDTRLNGLKKDFDIE